MGQLIPVLKQFFETHSNADDAAAMEAYMKGNFRYYGIKTGPRRTLMKEALAEVGMPEDWLATAREMFQMPQREWHMCGQELLFQNRKHWNANTIQDIEWFICTNSWWDSVDFLAAHCAGQWFMKFPERKAEITDQWNLSEHLWLVRSSILFQIRYKLETDPELLSKYILRHTSDTEFFIKKAIGWALREYGKHQPDWVRAFVHEHPMQKLSTKEALKNLGPDTSISS